MSSRRSALVSLLQGLLPSGPEAEFVRACLPSGTPGRLAFGRLEREGGDILGWLRGQDSRLAELLPLLDHALEINGAEADPRVRRGVRTAFVREERRYEHVAAIVVDRVRALDAAGLAPVVEAGVALAVTAYPSPGRRHCGNVVLSVPGAQLSEAVRVLGADPSGRAADPSGFPITVVASPHTRAAEPALIGKREVPVADERDLLNATGSSLLRGHTHPAIALVDGWMLSHAARGRFDELLPGDDAARSLEQLLLVIGLDDVTRLDGVADTRTRLTESVGRVDDATVAAWTATVRSQLGARRMFAGAVGPINKTLMLENLRRARGRAKLPGR